MFYQSLVFLIQGINVKSVGLKEIIIVSVVLLNGKSTMEVTIRRDRKVVKPPLPPGEIDMKNIGIFIDVQNIYYTTRDTYNKQFNYRELWRRLSEEGNISIANAYAIDRGHDKQMKFQEALRKIGFTVKLKPYIQRSDGSAKGDWDVGITIDVLESVRGKLDTVILLSGDGDFALLLEKIKKSYGVTAEVYGVPSLTSQSLIDASSFFHPIKHELLLA